MADNRNNDNIRRNKDDIDDFFAQFDNPGSRSASARRNPPPERPKTVARRSRPQGRTTQPQRRTQPQRDAARAGSQRSDSTYSSSGTRSAASSEGRTSRSASAKKSMKNKAKKSLAAFAGGNGTGGSGRSPVKEQSRFKKIIKTIVLACLAIGMGAGIYAAAVIVMAPGVDTDNIYDMLSQRSIMYDSEGNEIENLYFSDGNRTILSYDEIPENMVHAVVSIEDRNFWDHNGFNFIRMAGAVVDSVFGGGQISGTSTITQQLARNVYLSDIKSQRSLSRKITEAYYTILLEKNLSKEQIMEAYLNTIFLGFNSYGIQAASQAYFSKDAQDLTVLECAALAALPQSPDSYALVKTSYSGSAGSSLPVISSTGSATYLYNGEVSKTRRDAVLNNMAEEGYITSEERDQALAEDLQSHIKIGTSVEADESSYFTDFAIEQLTEDIISEYGISRADARDMIYTNGLKIYTTMDSDIQAIVEEEFADDSHYSGLQAIRRNSEGDILSENGNIMLYDYSHYFNDDDQFVLESGEYRMNGDGSMTILSGKRLNIYDIEVNGEPDVSIEFKGMYTREDGSFYFIEGGALSIPQGYTTKDGSGNAVISAQFFKDYPDFFTADGDSYIVTSDNYSLKQKVRQPQAATVIMENETGEIKAMMGGRGTTGSQLFNRATSGRQPGSVMKPISVYGPALQMSYEYSNDNKKMKLDSSDGSDWGNYITAGSIINDSPVRNLNGRSWPKNWYSGYKGQMTLRHAVEQSVNTCAVKTYEQIGPDYAVSMLKKSGVTTIVEDGDVNDLNAAALALGGMTKGISPLEVTAAYATFPNGGVYKSPIAYTKVLNSNDELLFEKQSEEERVYNKGVAWIMTDILRTVVTNGLGTSASIGSQPVGGKTGTTTDSYDLWFCGFTPQYTAALWMGNDMNIELSAGSSITSRFWADIMRRVCADLPRGSFGERPSNVTVVNGEYYIEGTYSDVTLKSSGDSTQASSAASSASQAITDATTKAPTETQPQPTETSPTESQTQPGG